MTNRYPLLTKGNVEQWYWKEDPPWSAIDIAKAVGCTSGAIYYFMKKNHMPRRNFYQAAKIMLKCPFKVQNRLEANQSIERRNLISEKAVQRWQDPQLRKKQSHIIRSGLIKKGKIPLLNKEDIRYLYWDENLSSYDIAEKFGCSPQYILTFIHDNNIQIKQFSSNKKKVLAYLLEHGPLLAAQLPNIYKRQNSLRRSLKTLYENGWVTRVKIYVGGKSHPYQFQYSITAKGKLFLLQLRKFNK